MVRAARRSPADLPQQAETWHVAVQQLRIWIAPPDTTPWRPFVIVVFNLDAEFIQAMELVETPPTPQRLLTLLYQSMTKRPKAKGQKAHRPTRLQVEDALTAATITPDLAQIGIQVQQHPRPDVTDEMLQGLESHLRGGPEIPGLLAVEGATPELIGQFFAAAAEFYRAAPWVHLADDQTLAVHVAPEPAPCFVQLMGHGGIEYGLAMHRRWEDVLRFYGQTDDPLERLPPEGGHSFSFETITHLPFADLEALAQHGWEVAAADAYPCPLILTREKRALRPSAADLRWYTAALRAIPSFVRDHLRPDATGDYVPVTVTLAVPTGAGATTFVTLTYPGGKLPQETRPRQLAEWPDPTDETEGAMPPFDRRLMEKTLAGMAASLGAEALGAALTQAQEVMYQAWEERNPARRIALAHQALALSPGCADAYVLLAEEAADTLGDALAYYQQGVAAGEQALGEAYFVENVGHFWGLLETRPYMRARHGLANALWEVGRKEEALAHYRELLRLNPGDNQGIRYILLDLLLALDRDDEVQALLQQYAEDGMADWLYSRALVAFRAGGASSEAEGALQEALSQNRHIPAYLTGRKRIPTRLPSYIGLGDDNEAVVYAAHHLSHWRRTPGAMAWLQDHLKTAPAGRGQRKVKRARRK